MGNLAIVYVNFYICKIKFSCLIFIFFFFQVSDIVIWYFVSISVSRY